MMTSLDSLPLELSSKIASFLEDIHDRLRLRSCCKSLKAAVADAELKSRCIAIDRSTPGDLTIKLAGKTIHADSLPSLIHFRQIIAKKIVVNSLSIGWGPSSPEVDDHLAEFLEGIEMRVISMHFDGSNPSAKLSAFIMRNKDKQIDLRMDGFVLNEELLLSFEHPTEIGFDRESQSTIAFPLFAALVTRGDTLTEAPITIDSREQFEELLQVMANSPLNEQTINFTADSSAFNEFIEQMSSSNEWARDYFDDRYITYAYKHLRLRQYPTIIDTGRIEIFKIQESR